MADYDAQPGRTAPDLSPAQREADEAELYAGLRGVAGIVAGAQKVIDLLRDVAEFAVQAIPGVDGAGVALVDTRDGAPTDPNMGCHSGFRQRHRHRAVRRPEGRAVPDVHAVEATCGQRVAGQ